MKTLVQKAALNAIEQIVARTGRPATLTEVQRSLGYRSKGSTSEMLRRMIDRGSCHRCGVGYLPTMGVRYFKFNDETKELEECRK